MNGITPDQIEGFVYGALAGLLVGCGIGAAGMYALHCQAINAHTQRVLKDMRADWDR